MAIIGSHCNLKIIREKNEFYSSNRPMDWFWKCVLRSPRPCEGAIHHKGNDSLVFYSIYHWYNDSLIIHCQVSHIKRTLWSKEVTFLIY